ncbi:MAG: ATP-binding protein [Pseudomonadota bacterium]|nr:ATP-binding protein [Pseudomonadota bacterium]
MRDNSLQQWDYPLLQKVLDSIADSIYIINRRYQIVCLNQAASRRVDKENSAIIGNQCHRMIFDQAVPCPFCRLDKVFAAGESEKTNFSLLDTDGRNHVFELSFYPILEPGSKIEACMVMFRDITENVGLFSEISRLKGLAAMGEYAAELTHEIRNPLNSIEIQMMLLKRVMQELPEDAQQEVNGIIEVVRLENQRLNLLASDFLLMKKSRELSLTTVDINALLSEVVSLLKPEVDREKVVVDLSLSMSHNLMRGDWDKLKQVFVNLVKNGIEALAGQENGRLGIMVAGENNQVIIDFIDNGPGIPYAEQLKIFNLFYTTKATGTGVGLHLCRDIIEAHGGDISFVSDENGSAFKIKLPQTELSADG